MLKETVEQLKNFASSAAVGGVVKNEDGDGDGWDCEDDPGWFEFLNFQTCHNRSCCQSHIKN